MEGRPVPELGLSAVDAETATGHRHVEHPNPVELVEPWAAGRNDPPMQDWLRLPIGDSCPADPNHECWGTKNPIGYFCVRYCHTCKTEFRGAVTAYTISKVVDALMGTPVRLARAPRNGRKRDGR